MDISGLSRGRICETLAVSMIGSLLRVPGARGEPRGRFYEPAGLAQRRRSCSVPAYSLPPSALSLRAKRRSIGCAGSLIIPDRRNLAKLRDLLAMPFLFGSALVYVLLEGAFAAPRVRSRHPARHRPCRPDSRARL